MKNRSMKAWSETPDPAAVGSRSERPVYLPPPAKPGAEVATFATVLFGIANAVAVTSILLCLLIMAFYLAFAAPGYVYKAVLDHIAPVGMLVAGLPALAGTALAIIATVKQSRAGSWRSGRTVTLCILAGVLSALYLIGLLLLIR